MNKAFTAKAVVECDVKLHRAAESFSLDLGFDVKSCCTVPKSHAAVDYTLTGVEPHGPSRSV